MKADKAISPLYLTLVFLQPPHQYYSQLSISPRFLKPVMPRVFTHTQVLVSSLCHCTHTAGEAAVHPAGKCFQASCHWECRDGCIVSLGLGRKQMARHPARHPLISLPWYRECPQPCCPVPLLSLPRWAPQHLSRSQCHLSGRDTCVLGWGATGMSPG